jgi:hypothetical protein
VYVRLQALLAVGKIAGVRLLFPIKFNNKISLVESKWSKGKVYTWREQTYTSKALHELYYFIRA